MHPQSSSRSGWLAPIVRRPQRNKPYCLRCEPLEERAVPALFTVPTAQTFGTSLKNNGAVAVADLDKDGKDDAILANFGTGYSGSEPGNTITVLKGQANGTFALGGSISTGGENVSFVTVADINNDTWPDVVVTNGNRQNTGSLTVFKNNNGTLEQQGNPISTGGRNASCVRLADFTGDGILDAVVTNFGFPDEANGQVLGKNVTIFQGNGAFGFAGPITTITRDEMVPTAAAVGDFDGDGLADLALTSPGIPPTEEDPYPNGSVYVYKASGAGAFTGPNIFDSGGVLPINIQAADLNGNGKLDLVVANSGDPRVDIFDPFAPQWEGAAVGVLMHSSGTSFNTSSYTADAYGTFAVAVANFDNAGGADIAAINYGEQFSFGPNTYVSMYMGNGSGGFVSGVPSVYDVGTNSPGGQYLAVGDFDQNGSPDLVTVGAENKVGRLLNTTVFAPPGPTVTINQANGQADPTNAGPIAFDVVFSAPVNGFDAADISFAGSTVGGTLSAQVSGTGPTYTISVSGMTGNGLVRASIPANAATAVSGGASSQASTSTDNTVTFDTAPTVTINQAAGQADPTTTGPITFTVVFSETVNGFTGSDVSFAGSTVGGTLSAQVSGTGPTYTISVSGMTGNGTVVASIPANVANDALGNLNVASTSTDNSVTFNTPGPPPTVTINQATGQPDPTNASPISYTVVFSEAVTGFDGSDIDFAGSTVGGTLSAQVSGPGPTYTVTITGMTGTGDVKATVKPNAVLNGTGVGNTGSTSTDNTVAFDGTRPTVTINQASGQADPTNTGPVQYTVVFSENVTGFNSADVSLAGSTAGGTLTVDVTGSLNTYTVTVTGMTTTGSVIATVVDGAAQDALTNTSQASTSTDNTVQYVNIGQVGFKQAVFNTGAEDDTGGLTTFATITLTRSGQFGGSVSIDYGTAPDTARTGGDPAKGLNDYTPVTSTITWADGEGGDKTFTIPINHDGLNEGRELIQLSLSNLQGSSGLGLASAVAAIAPSDGQGPGTYFDHDLDKVRIALNGKTGSLKWFRTDPDGNGLGPIELIELKDTLPDPLKPKAALVIAVTKSKTGNGIVPIGAITGSADSVTPVGLRAINARKAELNGAGINFNGYLGALTIGNIVNGADVMTGATANPKQKTRINALAITNGPFADPTVIDVDAAISSLTALSLGSGSLKATVKAPAIGSMVIRGAMSADVTVAGAPWLDLTKNALGALRVKGDLTGSTLKVNGNVGAVVVGSFRDSNLFVGYDGPGVPTGSGFNVPALLGTFRATGKIDGFANSKVVATAFRTVSLASLDSTNGTNFGFYADSALGTFTIMRGLLPPMRFSTPQQIDQFVAEIVS